MTVLFISDLHLDRRRPDITEQCLAFFDSEAKRAEALFILGDLFEAWVGDDDRDPEKIKVIHALRNLSHEHGVQCHFMSGNRDFLTGQVFGDRSGCRILEDPTVVRVYERQVLLTHGDALCTDDSEYQKFRAMVRDPVWQQKFLEMPLQHRLAMASQARDASRMHTASAPDEIMDVNPDAVTKAMRDHGVYTLVHGHTHRPGVHRFRTDGRDAIRIVLGDWYEQGSVLRWTPEGFRLESLPR